MEIEGDVRIVLVGDSGCGKTKLINRFIKNSYTEKYSKTGFDKLQTKLTVRGKPVNVTIWDTSGLHSYSVLRPLVYRESDVALVCYDIVKGRKDVQRWVDEVLNTLDIPVVLCGCASDAANSEILEETSSLGDRLGLDGCITSSKTGFNTKLVFELCILAAQERSRSTSDVKRLRRPTSLKLEEESSGFLRNLTQKQRNLRIGINSLIVSRTEAQNISRNVTSPFSPYSPQGRNAGLAHLQTLRPVPERPASSQSAQIRPSRLSCRPSRPSSRALPRPVPPPTSPCCDIQSSCHSPTSSILSGPLSPISSVLSPFPSISEASISSPFPSLSDNSSPSLFTQLHEKTEFHPTSDGDSISSQSQTDSISVRGGLEEGWSRWGDRCRVPWGKVHVSDYRKKNIFEGKQEKCILM